MNNGEGCVISGIMLVIVLLLTIFLGTINMITPVEAVTRFAELAEVGARDIVVVRHSNNSPFLVGDPHDVTFELLINGTPTTGRCTSGVWSPMVCRLYSGGE